jgi:transcriptional regulator with XRE-family HTH domain
MFKGQSKVKVAAQFGVTICTVRKWLRRYQAEGLRGLEDRSSRARHSPAATAQELSLAVLALRRQRLTLATIARQLGLSRATAARICARAGSNRLSKLELPAPVVRREGRSPGSCCIWISRNSGESCVSDIALPASESPLIEVSVGSTCMWRSTTLRVRLIARYCPMGEPLAPMRSCEQPSLTMRRRA